MVAGKGISSFNYALKALIDLALYQGIGPVTVRAIAKRRGIPVRYLEQLFNRLKRHGIVQAGRGPRGGYRLKKPASQISLSEIFQSLGHNGARTRRLSEQDPAAAVWRKVETAVHKTLESATLEDLVAKSETPVLSNVKHSFTFHI
ncbi:MAG: Rrf2 family transcriptional regulator [Candidatus Omnitrophica bacterium]|nr:Rrf2 family transcriptional regulator [Candidatus Omnitrophota bacterium]